MFLVKLGADGSILGRGVISPWQLISDIESNGDLSPFLDSKTSCGISSKPQTNKQSNKQTNKQTNRQTNKKPMSVDMKCSIINSYS